MAGWKVDTVELKQGSSELQTVTSRLRTIIGELEKSGNLSHYSFEGRYELQRKLDLYTESVEGQTERARKLSEKLAEIAVIYEGMEERVRNDMAALPSVTISDGEKQAFTSGGGQGGGAGGGGGRGGSEENKGSGDSKEENIKDPFIELIKAHLTVRDKTGEDDYAGLLKVLIDYYLKFRDFWNGDKKGWSGAADWCNLADTSTDFWKGIYNYLKKYGSSQFAEQWGGKVAGVGIAGSVLGLFGGIFDAADKTGSDAPLGDKIAAWIDSLSGGVDIGKGVYDLRHLKDLVKNKNGVTPAGLWAVFAETLIGTASQGSKSVGKYLEDGKWDLMDTAQTGVDMAVTGLSKIVFGVTSLLSFGAVSEKTLGIDAQNISEGLKEWAKNVGQGAGQYIVDHPEMNEKYQNGNCFDRFGLTVEGTFKSLFGW